jgi:ABC-2 type transport system permease protein
MNYRLALRGISVTAYKDMLIYYKKAPVFIFGLILPTFLFFAFFVGRQLDIVKYFPGFLAMSLFFTASSVGPIIIPWEKQSGTFERLLSYPVNVTIIILGDVLAGALFGIIISSLIFLVGVTFLTLSFSSTLFLTIPLFFIVGNLCFAGLGVLLSSPAGRVPANVMMLAALVRFPLIFISGVFIPLSQLSSDGRMIAYFSPLTYLVDGLNAAMGQTSLLPIALDILMLGLFTLIFVVCASIILKRKSLKGL